jgi:hypothetical protein
MDPSIVVYWLKHMGWTIYRQSSESVKIKSPPFWFLSGSGRGPERWSLDIIAPAGAADGSLGQNEGQAFPRDAPGWRSRN